jgi:DNA-binding response OmpR family regulator
MRILIVEDEDHIADGLRFNLEAEGHEAEVASEGETALEMMANAEFDAVVLDIMLPGIDGFEVAKRLRQREDFTPILMLTARGRAEDVLRGFSVGTDDYLPKPFDLNIFLARMNGLLRRREWDRRKAPINVENIVLVNGRSIDFDNLELKHDEQVVTLTVMEAKLLRYLMANEGRAISRNTILEEVWGLHEDTDTRAIDNFIVRLRKHLEDEPNDPKILRTVRGIGYKFVDPEKSA